LEDKIKRRRVFKNKVKLKNKNLSNVVSWWAQFDKRLLEWLLTIIVSR
jgi:hypothetical protein